MKTNALPILIFTLFSTVSAFAGGGSGGHAGDPATYPFYRTTLSLQKTFRRIKSLPDVRFSARFDVERFAAAVDSTYLVSTEEPIFVPVPHAPKGVVRPAAFKSEKNRITIQRKESAELAKNDPRTYVIEVIHEYLAQMKYRDSRFGEWDEHSLSEELMVTLEKFANIELDQHSRRLQFARHLFSLSKPIHLSKFASMTWNCLEINALPEETFDTASIAAFKTGRNASDRLDFRAVRPIGDRNNHSTTSNEYIQSWVEIDRDERAEWSHVFQYDAVRVGPNGDLMIERGTKNRFPDQLPSLARVESTAGAISYFYCPLTQNIQAEVYQKQITEFRETIQQFLQADRSRFARYRLKKLMRSIDENDVVFFDMSSGLPENDGAEISRRASQSMGHEISNSLLRNLRVLNYKSRGEVDLSIGSIDVEIDNAYAIFFSAVQHELDLLPDLINHRLPNGISPFERLDRSVEALQLQMIEDALKNRSSL